MSQHHYTAPNMDRSTTRRNKLSAAAGGVVAALWLAAPAAAANFNLTAGGSTWTGSTWSPSAPINQPGDLAYTSISAGTMTLDTSITIGAIRSSVVGSAPTWSITGTSNTITMDNNGAEAGIYTNGQGYITVAPNVIITDNNLFIGRATGAVADTNVTINGNITVAGSEERTLSLRAVLGGNPAAIINGSIGATSTGTSTLHIAANGGATGTTAGFQLNGAVGGAVGVASTITISNTNAGTSGLSISGSLGASVLSVNHAAVNSSTTLSGNNSSYAGATSVTAGTLNIGSDTALGGNAATLWIGSGTTINTANGIRNLAATNAVTMNGSFNFTGSNSLSLGGPVTLNTSLVTINALGSTLTLNGGIGEANAGSSVNKTGAGNLVMTGNSSFTGSLTVSAGAVTLSGNGSIASAVGGATVRNGALLLLDNAATNNTNRMSGPLTLIDGGRFELVLNADNSVTETIGNINLGAGGSFLSIGSGIGQNNTLAAQQLTRTDFGTGLFRGTDLGQGTATRLSKITLTSTPTLVGTNTINNATSADTTQSLKIVPYLFGGTVVDSTGSNFVTYDETLGLRVLSTNQQTVLTAGSVTAASPINARSTSTITIAGTGELRVNSLLGSGGSTLSGSGGSLRIDSGALATPSGSGFAIGKGFSSIILANGEGVITTSTGGQMTVHSPVNVTGSSNLIKTGTSTLILTADNLWTGQTFINQGLFQLGAGGNTGNLAASAGTINITTGTSAAVRFSRNNDFTVNSSIVGAGTVTKLGAGNMTATGSNSFLGLLSIIGGKVTLDAANASPGTSTNYLMSSASAVRMESGSVEFKAKAGAGNVTNQSITGLTIGSSAGLSSVIINRNGSDGANLTLTGPFTQGGNTLSLFDISSGSTMTTSEFSSTVATALVRTASRYDFALTVSNNLGAANAVTDLPASGGTNTTNYRVIGTQTLGGATTARTVRIDTTGTGESLNLGANSLASGGVMFVGAHNYSIDGAGALSNGGSVNLHHFGTGKLTITAGLGSGTGTVIISGIGGLVDWNRVSNLTPTTTANGLQQVTGATVRLSHSGAINLTNSTTLTAGTGNLNINGNAIIELASGNFTRDLGSSTGKVQWLGNGGFSAFDANRTVSLSSNAALTWASTASFVGEGQTLILGSNYSTHTVDFTNAIALGTVNRVIEARDGADNGVNGAVVDGKVSGVLSGTINGGITKTGAGTLELSANNTYAGDTIVAAGRLRVTGTVGTGNVAVASGATLEILDGDSSINAIANNATLNLANVGGVEGVVALNFTGEETIGRLVLGGVTYKSGYFSAASNPDYFTGTGVIAVPEPSVAMLGLAGAGMLAMRRRTRRPATK